MELPAALARFAGGWVDYGLLEAAYPEAKPIDVAKLAARYGPAAIVATQ